MYHWPLYDTVTHMSLRILLITALLIATSGCAIVYQQPVFQGNILEKSRVDQLKEGMSQQQVAALLGTPAVQSPFDQSRWDYVASNRRDRGDTEVKNLTVFFEGGNVVRWEGEYFPENDQALAQEMLRFGNLPKDDKKRRR